MATTFLRDTAREGQAALHPATIASALHSSSVDALIDMFVQSPLASSSGGSVSWEYCRNLGVGWWVRTASHVKVSSIQEKCPICPPENMSISMRSCSDSVRLMIRHLRLSFTFRILPYCSSAATDACRKNCTEPVLENTGPGQLCDVVYSSWKGQGSWSTV